jgi:hypothetical protein
MEGVIAVGLTLALLFLVIGCEHDKKPLSHVIYEFECSDKTFQVCRYETKECFFLGLPCRYTRYFDCETEKDVTLPDNHSCLRREISSRVINHE